MADRMPGRWTARPTPHHWMIAVLIEMVEYAERNRLSETENALIDAAERISVAIRPGREADDEDPADHHHHGGDVILLSDYK